MRNQKHRSISGKGYYIALVLCAAAIGISGFFYYRNQSAHKMETDPAIAVEGTVPARQQKPATVPGRPRQDPEATVPAPKTMKTGYPVDGKNVAGYAMDCLSYNETTRDWRTHNGVDFAAETGTSVCAAADGTVYTVYEDDSMGMTVVLRHENGYVTRYASLSQEVDVKPGQTVKLGEKLGKVGHTALLETALGDHLHFSVSCNDKPVNPMDFLSMK